MGRHFPRISGLSSGLLVAAAAVFGLALGPSAAHAATLPSSYNAIDLGPLGPTGGPSITISPNGAYVMVPVFTSQGTFDHDVLYSTATKKSVSLPAGTLASTEYGTSPGETSQCQNGLKHQFLGDSVDNSGRAYGQMSVAYTISGDQFTPCYLAPAVATSSGARVVNGSGFSATGEGSCSYLTAPDYGNPHDIQTPDGSFFRSSGSGRALGEAESICTDGGLYTFVESGGGGPFSEVWNQLSTPMGLDSGNTNFAINDSGTIAATLSGSTGVYEWKGTATPEDVLPGYGMVDTAPSNALNNAGDLLVYNGSTEGLYRSSTSTFTEVTGPGGTSGAAPEALNNHDEVIGISGGQAFVWSPTSAAKDITIANSAAVGGLSGNLEEISGLADNGDIVADAPGPDGTDNYLLTPACGGSADPAGDFGARAGDLALTATTSGGCPLNVTITALGGKDTGSKHPNTVVSGASLDDLKNGDGKLYLNSEDLLVKVTDPSDHDAPVHNADVTIIPGGFSGDVPSYPGGAGPGHGHVCTTNGKHCFSGTVTGLKTGDGSDGTIDGGLKLTYWPPGIVRGTKFPQGHITFGANATVVGSCGCTRSGVAKKPVRLTIVPNQFGGTRSGSLNYSEQLGLIEALVPSADWATPLLKESGKELAKSALESAYTALAESEKFAFEYPSLLAVAKLALDVIKEYEEKKHEPEREAMAEVFDALKVVDSGLGYDFLGVSVSSGGPVASDGFLDAFAGRAGSGMLSRLAKELNHLAQTGNVLPRDDLPLTLRIFEVSYCPPDQQCGTDDGEPEGSPFLDFNFGATPHAGDPFAEDVVQPYAPALWVKAQTQVDSR